MSAPQILATTTTDSSEPQGDAHDDMVAAWEQPPRPEMRVVRKTRLLSLIFAVAIGLIIGVGIMMVWAPGQTVVVANSQPKQPSKPTFDDEPTDSTTPQERKEFQKFLGDGRSDVKKWRDKQNFDKSAPTANVALTYLCMAKSTVAGRYYAASRVDDDQNWGIFAGMKEGDPGSTARKQCPITPPWAALPAPNPKWTPAPPEIPQRDPSRDRARNQEP